MSVAFRAPRAPIERPKRPSSRFSFYRRIKVDITTLKGLLYKRFPSKSIEVNVISFDIELIELK